MEIIRGVLFLKMIVLLNQFPTVCNYHDATYSVAVMDVNNDTVAETGKILYDRDGQDEVTVVLEGRVMIDTEYTAIICVTTAVDTEMKQFSFG